MAIEKILFNLKCFVPLPKEVTIKANSYITGSFTTDDSYYTDFKSVKILKDFQFKIVGTEPNTKQWILSTEGISDEDLNILEGNYKFDGKFYEVHWEDCKNEKWGVDTL